MGRGDIKGIGYDGVYVYPFCLSFVLGFFFFLNLLKWGGVRGLNGALTSGLTLPCNDTNQGVCSKKYVYKSRFRVGFHISSRIPRLRSPRSNSYAKPLSSIRATEK